MKLIVEISEEDYKWCQEQPDLWVGHALPDVTKNAIANGIRISDSCKKLIDADNLMSYCQNQKDKTISCNDIARFPFIKIGELENE